MLRTPDQEDEPLPHRPLPSVDIALLPHELRAVRMQRIALAGGVALLVLIGLALIYGPAVFTRARDGDARDETDSDETDALAARDGREPQRTRTADVRDDTPIDLRGGTPPVAAHSNAAARVVHTATSGTSPAQAPHQFIGQVTRSEHKFGRAKSWHDALVGGGASYDEAEEIIAALQKLVDFRRGKPEDVLIFERDSEALHGFEYRAGLTEVYRATRSENGALRGIKVAIPIESRRIAKGTFIAGSLGHSLEALGLGPSLASSVIEAFDSRVMFTRDTRVGDSVKLIVSEEYVDGTFLRYTPVQAVEYTGERCGKLRAYWFEPNKGDGEFFDELGRAVHGGWLRTPLRYDHVSSPFNLKRRHPILKRIMPHLGIDYSAGTGTPVFAAANGTVTFAGPRGANGNLVSLRHSNGFESHYAHLWRIAPGIKPGVQVTQRQTIGQVGSTGRSTGPHLHFALERNGRFLDPASQLNGPGELLSSAHLPRFRANMQRLRAELEHVALAPAPSTDSLPKPEEPADDEDLDL